MSGAIPYERRRNCALPWGYWLVANGERPGWPPLEDEDGRGWDSVRQAFWQGRLGMPHVGDEAMTESLEFLLSVLAILDRRIIGLEERAMDIFDRNWGMSRFYAQWLHSQRLIDPSGMSGVSLEGPLSPEGRAILVMLASTRTPADAPLPIGMSWISAHRGLDHGFERADVEELVSRQEVHAQALDYRMVRVEIAGRPALRMLGPDVRPSIPRRRTVWSMVYPDYYARDRFYLWAHERIDRWEHWGGMAGREGAAALSAHLLALQFCDREIEIG